MLYRASNRLIGGAILGRLPFTWVSSVTEITPNPLVDGYIEDRRPGAPACTLTFPAGPLGFECFTRSVSLSATTDFVAVDCLVSPRSGLVWRDGGPMLGESYGSLEQFLSWGYAAHDVLTPREVEKLDADTPVACVPSVPYFHLLLESLPALLRLTEREDPTSWLLWSGAPGYARELAMLLGGTVVSAPGPVRVPRTRVVGRRSLSGHFDPGDLERLRRFGLLVSARSTDGPDRIFVTRAGATRSLTNEAEIGAFLEEEGFRVVDPGRYPIVEQMALFRAARTVVGSHGAGLANLAWCGLGTKVIELLRPERNLDCYARLSHLAGLEYQPLSTVGGRADLADLARAIPR